jgi:hypothetical protein
MLGAAKGALQMTERNEIKDIVQELVMVRIAIQSLNPDPTQTIGQYRKSQRRKAFWLIYSAVVSSLALLASIYTSL